MSVAPPSHEPVRQLWARDHTTVHAGMGVFLGGPTPPDGQMEKSWRRAAIARLAADPRLCPCMTVVSPEPESGRWADVEVDTGHPCRDRAVNQQTQWEWQYLERCAITAFWLPTYWGEDKSGPFPPNIGPTTRWEVGYFFSRWERSPQSFDIILGSPDDADGVKWPLRLARSRGVPWYHLAKQEKEALVADAFVEAIAQALLRRKWCECR